MNLRCCPLCGAENYKSAGSGFYKCCTCGAVVNAGYRPLGYDDAYFTDDYRAQYGKTYFDDFDNIYRMSGLRIDKILKNIRSQEKDSSGSNADGLSLLDIGSAAGFFLKCASDRGFTRVEGIEISSFAAGYSRENFGFPVTVSPFDDAEIKSTYDVITAWYFIEHSADPARDMKRIFDALKPGGVFAFSAPSSFGPLYCCDRAGWISTHPEDHLVDFNPKSAAGLMRRIGFCRVKVYPAGIHPERIMSRSNPLYKIFSFFYRLFSRAAAFSDTIEVYSVK